MQKQAGIDNTYSKREPVTVVGSRLSDLELRDTMSSSEAQNETINLDKTRLRPATEQIEPLKDLTLSKDCCHLSTMKIS